MTGTTVMGGREGQADTRWFTEARFGMFIHWGTYSAAARHEWVRSHEKMSWEEYRKYFEHFYPDLYDPEEWAELAKQAGMKYFVVTTKHHEGFCLWDTQYTEYKATRTPWGRDLLKPMVEAFRAAGLRVGFYYSLIDWHHPHFTVDRYHPQREEAGERAKNAGRDMRIYAAYMRNQVRELLTQFGQVDLMWYDFSYPGEDGKGRADWESEQLYALTRELQPQVLVNNRLDLPGVGDFVTPEQVQPTSALVDEEGKPVVWEACQTFSGSWGYYRDEYTWKSVRQLLWMLIDGVSKNGNLLLNVGPTARGEFDERARARLRGIGEWVRRHGRSIYGCGAAPQEFACPADCRLTYNAKARRLYVHILNWPVKHLWLEGEAYKQRVAYAQFLHDASEVQMKRPEAWQEAQMGKGRRAAVCLELPVLKPPVEIPVIELFLK
ncbi:MAG: alpha-L-fucosidase [bacterium]|nr:alpha-L-fucosidase [bacterium]